MPLNRFDVLTKVLASRSSRRTTLLAAAGVAVGRVAITGAQEASPAAETCVSISKDEQVALAVRVVVEGLGEGNLDVIDEIYAPNGRHNPAYFPTASSPALYKEMFARMREAFPDIEVAIDEAFGDGEFVVVRWRLTGTFTGEMHGFPPTGEVVTWSGVNLVQFECGKVIESRSESDTLTQLGLNEDLPFGVAATPVSASEPAADCAETPIDENIDLALQWLDAWTSHDVSLYDAILAPETVHHFGLGRDTVGVEAVKGGVETFLVAFPDLVVTPERVVADGDLVAVRLNGVGTFTGPFLGAEPHGGEVTWSGINIYRIECGKVAESWSFVSGLKFWQQLGLVEPAATPAA